MNYLIGVDIGTTSTKAVLYDTHAQVLGEVKQGYPLYRDANGMAEQNPDQLVNAVEKVIRDVAKKADLESGKLLAVSFSSANQSVILLDKNHHPLTRTMTWADTRAKEVAANLRRSPEGKQVYVKTGTPIHPMSPLTKLMWLRKEQSEVWSKMAYVADIKSYLFYKLFGVFKVDISIASCTGMLNINTGDWDEQALSLAGISRDRLPVIVGGTTQEVGLTAQAQEAMKIDKNTPFVYGAFDGALSNLGVGATKKNTVAITIGTSAAVRVATDRPMVDPQQRLFCYAIDTGLWLIGGPLNNGGDVFQWAVEHFVDASAVKNEDVDPYTLANKVIANAPIGAHGLIFNPYLGGERAPLWDANARGSFCGLTQLHTRADMLRAVMEGINMNIHSVYKAVTDLVGQPKSVTATGGFAKSAVWKQMLADILDCQVEIPSSYESGCLGAITMAMKSLGMIDNLDAVQKFIGEEESYKPNPSAAAIYKKYQPVFEQLADLLSPAYAKLADLQLISENK